MIRVMTYMQQSCYNLPFALRSWVDIKPSPPALFELTLTPPDLLHERLLIEIERNISVSRDKSNFDKGQT